MNVLTLFLTVFFTVTVSANSFAKVTEGEAEKLGKELTPVGAEKAGNSDNSIPPWSGGMIKVPEEYKEGDFHPDPFKGDKSLLTITTDNYEQHKDRLTKGQIALLQKYPSFKMIVYPTRRSASYPDSIYEATKKNALTAELVENGSGISNAIVGVPFPIPQNGLEVIWNHLVRFRGTAIGFYANMATPMPDGAFNLVVNKVKVLFPYSFKDATFESLNNILLYYKGSITSPARLAGKVTLVHETLDQMKEPRKAWQYNPGQRRVRRAPNVAYDNPAASTDGVRTTDDFDMFNGATDRYSWELKGKKEIYIPYNSYRLHRGENKNEDIIRAGHINPDLLRYELHRVWVVEANLKEGMSHIYKKRVFYLDEDSWSIVAADQYDNHGQIWRVKEAYTINYYNIPLVWRTLEALYDLQSGRYTVTGLDNEYETVDFTVELNEADFSPTSLRRSGMR